MRDDATARFDSPELSEPTFAACEFWFVLDPSQGLRTLKLPDWPGQKVAQPDAATRRGMSAARRRALRQQQLKMDRKPKPWHAVEVSIRIVNDKLKRIGTW